MQSQLEMTIRTVSVHIFMCVSHNIITKNSKLPLKLTEI